MKEQKTLSNIALSAHSHDRLLAIVSDFFGFDLFGEKILFWGEKEKYFFIPLFTRLFANYEWEAILLDFLCVGVDLLLKIALVFERI